MSKVDKHSQSALGDYNDSQSNRDRLAAQAVVRYLASNPVEKLRAWVHGRSDAFSLSEAAQCLDMPAASARRDIRTRIGKILIKDIGCTRIQRDSATARFWYVPPQVGGGK